MNTNTKIMTLEEAMNYLQIKKNTLYKLLRNRELNAFKIGSVWKIPESAVHDYINSKINKGE